MGSELLKKLLSILREKEWDPRKFMRIANSQPSVKLSVRHPERQGSEGSRSLLH